MKKIEGLDPNIIIFLLDHYLARAIVYKMMKNAATTGDDPKMVAWYKTINVDDDKNKI